MRSIIKVGMADLRVATDPAMLTTLGLGSCVGIALFDTKTQIIGLAHVMLPYHNQVKNNSNIAKFADSGTDSLLEEMIKLGAKKKNIIAKLAGGAQMFGGIQLSEIMRIGYRNTCAAKEKLIQLKIEIVAQDTGGNFGRTIELYSETGNLFIKTIGHGTKEI